MGHDCSDTVSIIAYATGKALLSKAEALEASGLDEGDAQGLRIICSLSEDALEGCNMEERIAACAELVRQVSPAPDKLSS